MRDEVIFRQQVAEADDKRRNVTPAIRHNAHEDIFRVGKRLKGG